jgi:hypothetical protein
VHRLLPIWRVELRRSQEHATARDPVDGPRAAASAGRGTRSVLLRLPAVSEETWRPLGVDAEDEVAKYDALHDDVPAWMVAPFWAWIRAGISVTRTFSDGSGRFPMLDAVLAEEMAQTLRITLPSLRAGEPHPRTGEHQLQSAMEALIEHSQPLQIADYLLAHDGHAKAGVLDALLERSKVGLGSRHPR